MHAAKAFLATPPRIAPWPPAGPTKPAHAATLQLQRARTSSPHQRTGLTNPFVGNATLQRMEDTNLLGNPHPGYGTLRSYTLPSGDEVIDFSGESDVEDCVSEVILEIREDIVPRVQEAAGRFWDLLLWLSDTFYGESLRTRGVMGEGVWGLVGEAVNGFTPIANWLGAPHASGLAIAAASWLGPQGLLQLIAGAIRCGQLYRSGTAQLKDYFDPGRAMIIGALNLLAGIGGGVGVLGGAAEVAAYSLWSAAEIANAAGVIAGFVQGDAVDAIGILHFIASFIKAKTTACLADTSRNGAPSGSCLPVVGESMLLAVGIGAAGIAHTIELAAKCTKKQQK